MVLKNPIDRTSADGLIDFLNFNFKTVQEKVEILSTATRDLKLVEDRKYFLLIFSILIYYVSLALLANLLK
jgi:hypothetical protein